MSRERQFSNDPGRIWNCPAPAGSDRIQVTTGDPQFGKLREVIVDNADFRTTYVNPRCIIQNPNNGTTIIYFTDPDGQIRPATYRTSSIILRLS